MELLRRLGEKAIETVSQVKGGKKILEKNYFGHCSIRMDICIENMVKREIRGMGIPLITEERPERADNMGGNGMLILDPLDGSSNYATGYPAYSFAIAWADREKPDFGDVQASLVLDLASGTEYSSLKSAGFFIGRKKAKPAKAVGKPPLIAGDFGANFYAAKKVFPKIAGFSYMRMLGASTLDMALLARGALDAYVDVMGKLLVTHTAGLALMRDSGAIMTDAKGSEIDCPINQDTVYTVIAARKRGLHKRILGICSQ